VNPACKVWFLLAAAGAALTASAAADGVWLDIPFIVQEKNGCGPAALAMTIRYWGREADPAAIQRNLYPAAEKGVPGAAMERYLAERGFDTHVFRGEWQDLRTHLAQGRPLIVCFKPGRGPGLHYAVAAGVDERTVALNDPADRKLRKWDRAEFEKRWRSTGGWTLLAVPRPGS
jgi:ABC-type bacteriocin/lantibiotic exporter with double-glycine peptidase domain